MDAWYRRPTLPRVGDDLTKAEMDEEPPRSHPILRAIEHDMWGADSYVPILLLSFGAMVSFPLGGISLWLLALVTLPLTLGIVYLSFRRAGARRSTMRTVAIIAAVGTLTAIGSTSLHAGAVDLDTRVLSAVSSLSYAALLLLTLPAISARALQHRVVNLNTLAAALSAYLVIGLFFTSVYRFIDAVEGGGFFAQTADPQLGDFQYFSFVTLTTVGFGDLTAATSTGRATVIFEAVIAQVFLVTMVARVVSNLGQERTPAPEED
jgi:hypothetical protein